MTLFVLKCLFKEFLLLPWQLLIILRFDTLNKFIHLHNLLLCMVLIMALHDDDEMSTFDALFNLTRN